MHVLEAAGISVEEPRNPYNLTVRVAEMRNLSEDAAAWRLDRCANLEGAR